MKKTVLILGATSSIAKATAAAFAEQGYSLYLAGRDLPELERISVDLKIRYLSEVHYSFFDAEDFRHHSSFLHQIIQKTGNIEGVVIAFGESGDHLRAVNDFSEVEKIFNRNLIGPCAVLTHIANYFQQEKKGFIVGISSTSGERGNKNNYTYGASKAGLSLFLQGLRHRLYPFGIHVLTVKPYLVDTASTFGTASFFKANSPEDVGCKIVKAVKKAKPELYIPKFWGYTFRLMRLIPEKLLRRL